MRARKPWRLARRWLLGWNVRFTRVLLGRSRQLVAGGRDAKTMLRAGVRPGPRLRPGKATGRSDVRGNRRCGRARAGPGPHFGPGLDRATVLRLPPLSVACPHLWTSVWTFERRSDCRPDLGRLAR
jgi:hypothetical protein